MTVKAKFDAFEADFEAGTSYSVPRSVIETTHRATAEPKVSGRVERTKKVGEKAPPSFELEDAQGNAVSSHALLKKDPLAVSF